MFVPFLKPFMPQTHTVPGFRLGPDLPTPPLYQGLISLLTSMLDCGADPGATDLQVF